MTGHRTKSYAPDPNQTQERNIDRIRVFRIETTGSVMKFQIKVPGLDTFEMSITKEDNVWRAWSYVMKAGRRVKLGIQLTEGSVPNPAYHCASAIARTLMRYRSEGFSG